MRESSFIWGIRPLHQLLLWLSQPWQWLMLFTYLSMYLSLCLANFHYETSLILTMVEFGFGLYCVHVCLQRVSGFFFFGSRTCWLFHNKQYIHALYTDPQITLFSNFFIKNRSHGSIHTFKNYFATVFSVFSFQFQQNKFYPNRPYVNGQSRLRFICVSAHSVISLPCMQFSLWSSAFFFSCSFTILLYAFLSL